MSNYLKPLKTILKFLKKMYIYQMIMVYRTRLHLIIALEYFEGMHYDFRTKAA